MLGTSTDNALAEMGLGRHGDRGPRDHLTVGPRRIMLRPLGALLLWIPRLLLLGPLGHSRALLEGPLGPQGPGRACLLRAIPDREVRIAEGQGGAEPTLQVAGGDELEHLGPGRRGCGVARLPGVPEGEHWWRWWRHRGLGGRGGLLESHAACHHATQNE